MSSPNKFPGRCATCGASVAAGLGVIVRDGGRFVTYCEAHDPDASAAPTVAPPDLSRARTVWGFDPRPVAPGGLPPLADTMTDEQRAVATCGDSETVVAAVAGSGKTWVLVQRCLVALRGGATPERICVLAFNRKAADEFAERLHGVLGPIAQRINVSTFHAWAYRALRSWYPGAPWLQTDRILDAGSLRKEPVIARALARIGVTDQTATELDGWARVASRIANDMIDPTAPDAVGAIADLFEVSEDTAERFARFAAAYTVAKQECGRIDFDDMLGLVVQAIQQGTAHGRALATWYDHLMQDEAQDGNRARWYILDALHGKAPGKTLVSVGDTRQSINAFAGARPDLLLARIAAGATLLSLSTNWRSDAAIVALSNVIAKDRPWSVGKDAQPGPNAGPGVIDLVGETRPHTEVVCEDIVTALQEEPSLVVNGKPRYAILTRTRALLAGFQLVLTAAKVPTRVIGGDLGVWGSPIGRSFLAYVRLATDETLPLDDLLRIANTPTRYAKRDVTTQAYEQVQGQCARLPRALRTSHTRGNEHLADDIEVLRELPWSDQVRQIQDWLTTAYGKIDADSDKQAAVDAEDQAKMIEIVCDLAVSLTAPTLLDLVRQHQEKRPLADGEPAVLLSTIHTFKGLEADTVFAPYLVDGVLPHMKGEPEEERRLWYVLATRARRRLVILPFTQGRDPSPFLIDAGLLTEDGEIPQPATAPAALLADPAEQEAMAGEAANGGALLAPEPEPEPEPEPAPEEPYAFAIPPALFAFAEQATDAAQTKSAEGHGSRSVPVHRADLHALLVAGLGYKEGGSADQHTYVSPTVDGVRVVVYSSIPLGEDVSRDVGDDSIRVVALYAPAGEKDRPVLPKNAYCCRTRGWRTTLLDRIQSTYDGIAALTRCPTCGAPMAHRDGKRGPFLGCIRFPLCMTTRPVAAPAPVAAEPFDSDLPF